MVRVYEKDGTMNAVPTPTNQISDSKVSQGRSIKVIASEDGIEKGKVYKAGEFVGVAFNSAADGEETILNIEPCEYEAVEQLKAGDTFTANSKIYLDSNNEITATATGNKYVGVTTAVGGSYIHFILNY